MLSFAWHFACINYTFSMGFLNELISGHEAFFAAASESDKFLKLLSEDDSSEIEEEDSVSL